MIAYSADAQAFPHLLVKIIVIGRGLVSSLKKFERPLNNQGKRVKLPFIMPKRVGYIYDKMVDSDFIRKTILKASRGRKNRKDVKRVLDDLDNKVMEMFEMLDSDTFKPCIPKEKIIYDKSGGKYRTIRIAPFWPDGVVHWLIVEAMQPVFMRGMYYWSCASIPDRGTKKIRQKLKRIMQKDIKHTKYACEMDIAKYYPSIPIDNMIKAIEHKTKDKRLIALIRNILEKSSDELGKGLAIGYYLNQWLANFYLESLDHFILDLDGVSHMTRYMDNIIIFGANKRKLHKARLAIAQFMEGKLGVQMKDNWQVFRTSGRVVSAVGYRFSKDHIILRQKNFIRLARQSRRIQKRQAQKKPIAFTQAAGMLSRIGQLKHCNSRKVYTKYIHKLNIRQLKDVVREHSKAIMQDSQNIIYRKEPT